MTLLKNILERKPAGLIYHYTSQTGLLGIITKRCIWATNAHYQNDSKEFKHALDLSNEIIKSLRDNNPPSEEERLLRALKNALDAIQQINVFVSSFSEHKDMLSQWRGYCPRGNGFSIGFDPAQLERMFVPQGFRLVPCVYSSTEQVQLVSELIDTTVYAFRKDLEASINIKRALRHHSTFFMNKVISIAPVIKHSTFAEENEWRAVSFPISFDHPQIAYREGVSMLTPYFVLNIADDNSTSSIREIIVGPTPHMNLAMSSAWNFVTKNGISQLSVMPSGIPFRGW